MILLLLLIMLMALYVSMLALFIFKIHKKDILKNGDDFPFFSVIIPVRNEENTILNLLNSLVSQDYPFSQYEIIVVNDHSEDHTVVQVSTFKEEHQELKLKLINLDKAETGKKKAIAKGIRQALYSWIITTDADCTMNSNWLTEKAKSIANREHKFITFPVFTKSPRSFLERLQQVEWVVLMGLTFGSIRAGMALMCNGANLMYKKDMFNDVYSDMAGNLASGDDIFMLHSVKRKWGAQSIGCAFDPGTEVYTKAEKSFTSFLSQKVRWVSKSVYYRDFQTKMYGLLASCINLLIIIFLVLCLLVPQLNVWFYIIFFVKLCSDFLFGVLSSKAFKQSLDLPILAIYVLLYPIYFYGIIIISLFMKRTWKGRPIN